MTPEADDTTAPAWSRRPGTGAVVCLRCEKPPLPGRRLCAEHRAAGELIGRKVRKEATRERPCAIEGCDQPRYESSTQVHSYCLDHRRAKQREGDTNRRRAAGIPERPRRERPDVPEGSKWCWICEQIKSLEEFNRSKSAKDGLQGRCKPCDYAVYLRRREEQPERILEQHRQAATRTRVRTFEKRYGITYEVFQRMVVIQQGQCLICDEVKTLVPDHCHVGGFYRGALCVTCNSILGMAHDDVEVLHRAIEYLQITAMTPPT